MTLAKLQVCCQNGIMMRKFKFGVFHVEKVSNDLLKRMIFEQVPCLFLFCTLKGKTTETIVYEV